MFRVFASVFLIFQAGSAATPEEVFRAIRDNDLATLKQLVSKKEDAGLADSRGTTPLHYAAALGSVESVKLLIEAGADVQARNAMDATPLILAAPSAQKVALLLAKGADPNARSKAGRTALLVAASCEACSESVRLLLNANADVNVADERGILPLTAAAGVGQTATVQLLLARGARADAPDKARFSALMGAVASNNIELVKLLLSKGADVNMANTFGGKVKHGMIALTQLTPLVLAAPAGSVEMVRTLIAAGANVNAQDGRGMTPLMAAVSSENQDANVIKALLAAGADPNAVDKAGESVVDWANKFAHPSTLAILRSAGARSKLATVAAIHPPEKPETSVRRAAGRSMDLLHRSSSEFFKQSGCVGCHHQPVTDRAFASMRRAGLTNTTLTQEDQMRSLLIAKPLEPALLQLIGPGGEVDSVANAAMGFHANGIAANSLTDAMVHYIAARQTPEGGWKSFGISRVPMEDSNITRTALAVRVLRVYGWPARKAEIDERIARARAWMLKAEPRNSYERADLLLGLHWAGATASEMARVAAGLKREQRADGGWSQNKYLSPDAYATGLAMYALHESGQMKASDPAYKRGVDFLLKTQLEDGSWYVRSRSPKFQPYFQSGFPHDHDQWISASATAFAVMALAPAAETTTARAGR
jgi:ankyrin repeat protein